MLRFDQVKRGETIYVTQTNQCIDVEQVHVKGKRTQICGRTADRRQVDINAPSKTLVMKVRW